MHSVSRDHGAAKAWITTARGQTSGLTRTSMRTPGQFGQRFQFISDTESNPNRTPIPGQIGQWFRFEIGQFFRASGMVSEMDRIIHSREELEGRWISRQGWAFLSRAESFVNNSSTPTPKPPLIHRSFTHSHRNP